MMIPRNPRSSSPQWSTNTKLVIGLTVVAIVVTLLIYVRTIIGPLLLAFILAYLLHPVVSRMIRSTTLSWRGSVNLIYLAVFLVVGGLLAWLGITIVQQIQILIGFLLDFIQVSLPSLAVELSTNIYEFGPFQLDLTQFDLLALSEQLLATLQPLLVQSGALLSGFAASAVSTLGWLLFILVVSYFILAEAGQVPYRLVHIDIPGYEGDTRQLGGELQRIWSAFLRGQLIIFILSTILTLTLLSVVGLRLALAIAILAGVAKFIPYLGQFILLVVTGVAAFFQASNLFGLDPWLYSLLVLAALITLEQTFDNLVTPRVLGRTLDLHPAAILIGALIAFNLIGIVGLVLAAPVLASIKLVGRYTLRKMLDLDPWVELGEPEPPFEIPWRRLWEYSQERWREIRGGRMPE